MATEWFYNPNLIDVHGATISDPEVKVRFRRNLDHTIVKATSVIR